MSTPVDHFWHRPNRETIVRRLIDKLYDITPFTKEWRDTLFTLQICEEFRKD